jgi:hypothetical protein
LALKYLHPWKEILEMPFPPNATGSRDRVRLRRPLLNSIAVHGTVLTFNPDTGDFTALMDYQPAGATPCSYTRHDDKYVDQAGLDWQLVS